MADQREYAMISTSQIREHMEVVGSDGRHVGRVDHVEAGQIELAKLDLQTKGKHRLIPLSWVDFVDEKVHLGIPHEEAERRWTTAH
jgi:hypothetical protein